METTNNYEQFRNILASNLYSVVEQDQLAKVMQAVDMTFSGFDVCRKPVEIIVSNGIPEVVKYYLVSKAVSNLSKNTLFQYKYKLEKFFGEIRKSYLDITTNDIRIYLNKFKTEHNASDRYMESIRSAIGNFFQWLAENEYIARNPCAHIDHIKYQNKRREPMTSYDLEVLRWNCQNIREKALVDFIFSTGCRVSECSDINLSDINWDTRSAIIRHGKGNKQRIVYFNAESELTLQKYLEQRKGNDEALFVQSRYPFARLSPRAIENEIKKIGDRADIHAFPHRLRHTFATVGINGGMPLERLQKLMGHESPKTTLVYAKLNTDDLQREHRRVYT